MKFSDENLAKLKKKIAEFYNIENPDTVITYDELMKKEEREGVPNNEKYNVLVWKGAGDDAAAREDVLATILFIH